MTSYLTSFYPDCIAVLKVGNVLSINNNKKEIIINIKVNKFYTIDMDQNINMYDSKSLVDDNMLVIGIVNISNTINELAQSLRYFI